MNVKQLCSLLKAGVPFAQLKNYLTKEFKDDTLLTEGVKFFKLSARLPSHAFSEDRKSLSDALESEIKKWTLPEIDGKTIESVTDFSAKTGEQIKITIEEYKAYFDRLVSGDDDHQADLSMTLYSADKKSEFNAVMLSPASVDKIQKEKPWLTDITFPDQNHLYLINYIMCVKSAETDGSVSVAEGMARGRMALRAFAVTGPFINRKFAELFSSLF